MLKAQLQSKVFQLDLPWREVEDILTGDFFGVLDYLPRSAFLRDFVEEIVRLSSCKKTPVLDGVAWEDVELTLWPRFKVEREQVEPDVLIISNKWVLVVEVKLESGLGQRQPWREYIAGREVALERNLPPEAVFYVLITVRREDVTQTFGPTESNERDELCACTFYIRWSALIGLVERWLMRGVEGDGLSPEIERMLADLSAALRLRRTLAFSGFAFANQNHVEEPGSRIFVPSMFRGFVACRSPVESTRTLAFSAFRGFASTAEARLVPSYLVAREFAGFVRSSHDVLPGQGILGLGRTFEGFVASTPRVEQSAGLLRTRTGCEFLSNSQACVAAGVLGLGSNNMMERN